MPIHLHMSNVCKHVATTDMCIPSTIRAQGQFPTGSRLASLLQILHTCVYRQCENMPTRMSTHVSIHIGVCPQALRLPIASLYIFGYGHGRKCLYTSLCRYMPMHIT